MNARLLFVHALSPLHAGTGQGVGVIDLPICREKATGLPFLPGSSLKGTLRDGCTDTTEREMIFGPDKNRAEEHAGSAQFSDQRLVLLPVRSLAGTFAWATSPYVLRRLARDAQSASLHDLPETPEPSSIEHCIVGENCALLITPDQGQSQTVVLEDLDLQVDAAHAAAGAWARWLGARLFPEETEWQDVLAGRFCVVHDDALNFLLETATEITARVRLMEQAKTVERGGLWYEEALPTETILSGLLVATPTPKIRDAGFTAEKILEAVSRLTKLPTQLGGKATVGRGLCRIQLAQAGG